jgi:hypothetical protein
MGNGEGFERNLMMEAAVYLTPRASGAFIPKQGLEK